jgi:hypothetical protein
VAPSRAHKVAKAAGKAAPAVAVVGALAAVPQVRDLAISTINGVTAGPGQVAHGTSAGQVAGDAVGNAESVKASTYLPRHAVRSASAEPAQGRRTSTGESGVPAHRPARHHSSTPPPQPGSTSPSPVSSSTPGTVSTPGTSGSHSVPRCTGTAGMLPENYATIVDFLVQHGYSDFAAAGIAGNMYQESKGDPESVGSGGGGLIGFTPLPPGYVTGNPAADLQTQLNAVLTYNQQWSQFIPALNAATSAVEAADIYMNDFERPGIPAAANREGAAQAVAAACGI